MPEEVTFELKDAFIDGVDPNESDVNVRVRVLNVHSDKNRKLMDACRPLYEYSSFIDSIYKYRKLMDIESAVNRALDDMPKDWIIRDCLLINKAEVTLMLLTEYNEEETMQMFKEEGREEGILEGIQLGKQEGIAEGRFQIIVDLVNDKVISLEEAASRANMTIEEFKKRIQK
jgi:hypothetical protein